MLASDDGRSTRPFVHDAAAYGSLAATLGLAADAFEAELARRDAFLEDLASRGVCDAPAVADAVRDFGG